MYKIEKTAYGVRLTFGGIVSAEEVMDWLEKSRRLVPTLGGKFGVFVDMRTLKPLLPDSQIAMKHGQRFYKQGGMQRSVVILDNAITTMQFQRIARETGIYQWERYINASAHPNWERAGIDWLTKAEDPDEAPAPAAAGAKA